MFYEPGDSAFEVIKGVLTLQRISIETFLSVII